MKIETDKAVTIHYTLKDDDGQVLDSSEGRDPLAYLQGHQNLIPGLERELEGKSAGDSVQATIKPEDGYGKRDDSLVQTVNRSQFQNPDEVKLGAQFQVRSGEQVHIATITGIENDDITLDLNHPLADETLHFDVDVVDVREATNEELEHGHIHGAGGHQH